MLRRGVTHCRNAVHANHALMICWDIGTTSFT
jgi:hypothetical protein